LSRRPPPPPLLPYTTLFRSATGTHVERRADLRAAREQVLAAEGRIDFVVNTAGVLHRGELQETSEETVYAVTEINYLAPVFIAQNRKSTRLNSSHVKTSYAV